MRLFKTFTRQQQDIIHIPRQQQQVFSRQHFKIIASNKMLWDQRIHEGSLRLFEMAARLLGVEIEMD